MRRMISRFILLFVLVGSLPAAHGFALLGNYDTWQVAGLGYNSRGQDNGAPLALGEEYRWVSPTIYYAFDSSFLNYFGTEGIKAINAAMKMINDLPPVSTMSSNLTEFPLDTIRINSTAAALGLTDIKSIALQYLIEQLGLAEPERFTWTLRSRVIGAGGSPTNYAIISRNYDPVTLLPTPYVNSTLYTYTIQEFANPNYADAIDDVSSANTSIFPRLSVAGRGVTGNPDTAIVAVFSGAYYIGLTRDDVGGLRYLLKPTTYKVENLAPNSTVVALGTVSAVSGNTSLAWLPVGSVPGGGTGAGTGGGPIVAVNTALRGGKNKLRFVQANYDSILGTTFRAQTNIYSDPYVVNSRIITQTVRRVVTQPDILFVAGDLGVDSGGVPIPNRRSVNLISNDGINGNSAQPGPGVIQGQLTISYSTTLPFYLQTGTGTGIGTPTTASAGLWGSFDGTDTPPVVFPSSISIQDLEDLVLQGGN